MKPNQNPPPLPDLSELVLQINQALRQVPDKDWNYSRITLEKSALDTLNSPYVLRVDLVETGQAYGRKEITQLKSEVVWGSRHSGELGFLELVSLRLNKALLDCTSDEAWAGRRPVIRTIKKQELQAQNVVEALWYRIEEVSGEDFENR
jgi:hypothetical protein